MTASNIVVVEVTNPETGERVKKIRAKFNGLKNPDNSEMYPNGLNIFDPERDFDALLAHIKSMGKEVLPKIRIQKKTITDENTGVSSERAYCFISDTDVLETVI